MAEQSASYSASTKAAEHAQLCNKYANANRLMIDRVREIVDFWTKVHDEAEQLENMDVPGLAGMFETVIDLMQVFLTEEQEESLKAAMIIFGDFDVDPLTDFVNYYDNLRESCDEIEGFREDPTTATREEKEDARELCRENLAAFAEALEQMPAMYGVEEG